MGMCCALGLLSLDFSRLLLLLLLLPPFSILHASALELLLPRFQFSPPIILFLSVSQSVSILHGREVAAMRNKNPSWELRVIVRQNITRAI